MDSLLRLLHTEGPGALPPAPTSKEKRYFQQVERALASFDTVEEWADYISFLTRLSKALLLSGNANVSHIPYSQQIAYRLALCLMLKLPNGVHQKTLQLYETILTTLTPEALNSQISIWLPGLLPLILYCSIQLKPIIILLFLNLILARTSAKTLHHIAQPLILGFLPGLDDENSDTFDDFLELMDFFKKKLGDDAHFWQLFFICVINSPEKRLGALFWCNRRLPVFEGISNSNNDNNNDKNDKNDKNGKNDKNPKRLVFSGEAKACITPSPGLLIRCFASTISNTTSMVAANDIIVVRGFFDLLLSHLPLDSDVLTTVASKKDKELLLRDCLSVTLKKDMSLNRRLWSWLLGPENTEGTLESQRKMSRSEYFSKYSLHQIVDSLLIGIRSENEEYQLTSIKISLALIMDKWEISRAVTPIVFLPIMESAYNAQKALSEKVGQETSSHNNKGDNVNTENIGNSAVLITAKLLFDSVEAEYIWKDLIKLIEDPEKLPLLYFIISNFDISEDEMVSKHIPLATALLLKEPSCLNSFWIKIVNTLIPLIPANYLASETDNEVTDISNLAIVNCSLVVADFYNNDSEKSSPEFPWTKSQYNFIILSSVVDLIESNFDQVEDSAILSKLCELLNQILSSGSIKIKSADSNNKIIFESLLKKIVDLPYSTLKTSHEQKQANLITTLSVVKILNQLPRTDLSTKQRSKILRSTLSNLFTALTSSLPANYQVDAVNAIFELHFSFDTNQIEAGIVKLFAESTPLQRSRALWTIWTHSNQFSESDSFLSKPLRFVIDDLKFKDDIGYQNVVNFLSSVVKSGSTNRLLKLLTNPLLEFNFLESSTSKFNSSYDFEQFSYYILLIINVIKTDEKHLKESFNNELAVINNAKKLQVANSNNWDISTYKSLLLNIIMRVLNLKLEDELLSDDIALYGYYGCIKKCLQLFCLLLTGNESNFLAFFPLLLEDFSQFLNQGNDSEIIELVQVEHLICLNHILAISKSQVVNLNLLHIEEEGKEPPIIKFIVQGILKSQSTVLLQYFVGLLTKSLYVFNESVFSVLLNLSDVLVFKIQLYFDGISKGESFSELTDFEPTLNTLFSGLEDLLSISHSYLLTSTLRAKNDKNNHTVNDGFLGNVIQGVFLIESPSIRTTEENKRYSILLAFQDAVKTVLTMWLWADDKTRSFDSELSSLKSLAFVARKIKFKLRKFLESLIDLERQEVIETLVAVDEDTSSTIKLLHVLDGSRSQITLPHIFNSILSRLYPQALDEKQKSSLNSLVNAKELCLFLSKYIESIDDDTISDIWTFTIQFFKEVNSHSNHFKEVVLELLHTLCSLSFKISTLKLGDQGKYKKEVSEVFIKLFTYLLNNKVANVNSPSTNGGSIEEIKTEVSATRKEKYDSPAPSFGQDDTSATRTQEELHGTLFLIIENLDQILKDSDKVTSCVNNIIVSLVSPQIKSKRIHYIPTETISLISVIGSKYPQNKAWKSTVLDCFFDNSFFKSKRSRIELWEVIIQQWISSEKDKTLEIFAKISPPASSSTNIFNWNESSEVDNKVFNMKRASFVIAAQPKDFFLSYLSEIFNRFEVFVESGSPSAYKAELCDLLRVITLKFSEIHLLPYWILISQFLLNNFLNFQDVNIKELGKLLEADLKLVLKSCKLLDQLLLFKIDEFNLQEWLYVAVTPDLTEGKLDDRSFSWVDYFYKEKDLKSLKGESLKLLNDENNLKPLLYGVHHIDSLVKLRSFFQSLSLLQYERMYSLNEFDYDACLEDVYMDILVESE